MASGKPKQYGLILSSKGGTAPAKPKNVFGDDSDSDSEDGGDWVKKSLKRVAEKSALKRTTKVQMQKALEEDPTVFQYDEVYDDLEQKKEDAKASKKTVEKKPRYIQALLQTAEKRKKENERRIERQVQKEREEEGEQFADKESFVTSSYRQKLEEFKKQEEEEKRMERLEAIGDVTKQKDLTGFYRHLYRQTMGESLPGASDPCKTENDEGEVSGKSTRADEHNSNPDDRKKDRQYRKRRSSSSCESNSDHPDKSDSKPGKNVDADSDFTGSSSTSDSESSGSESSGSEDKEIKKKKPSKNKNLEQEEVIQKKKRKEDKDGDNDRPDKHNHPTKEQPITVTPKEKEQSPEQDKVQNHTEEIKTEIKKEGNISSESDATETIVKPKIDIWAKRTVGEAFDDAVQRYYERKAARAALRMGRG
ncbi:hypothetical protein ONE63_010753 [Megalurothrips usitatus]|uniref:Nuclear speckle splicing regulatory protein 1 N-terminal domain-containing protein n=1 Tax=Megalurothrips usitatus TaxID=439358 RepID=A0AAV7XKJ6_9NEOP|nr:hypothetical protein ONE63_010753 [Megalurothrips usitatus]